MPARPQRVNQNGVFLLGPTVMEYGSEAQKARFLPPLASGETIWAQAWSEPGAGSDLAALRAKAKREGDVYVIFWTKKPGRCEQLLPIGVLVCFAQAKKTDVIKVCLLSWCRWDAKGVTVRPIAQLDGREGFAEIFF